MKRTDRKGNSGEALGILHVLFLSLLPLFMAVRRGGRFIILHQAM